MSNFKILDWDSTFFGFKVASIIPEFLTEEEIENCCSLMDNQLVKMAYWKTPNDIINFPENRNICLIDIACTYSIDLPNEEGIDDIHISLYNDINVSSELKTIAVQCGIYSRFKLDSRFPEGSFERMYTKWIEKSVSHELSDDIITFVVEGTIAGIVTVYVRNNIGYIGLFGIEESMRGKGIGKHLLNASINYFIHRQCKTAQVITQINNTAACSIYQKCGFSLSMKNYCYHVWL